MTRAFLSFVLLLPTVLACDSGDESADDAAETEGDPLDFPPVECGEMTCEQGLICVKPSENCDYDLDPPEWVQPPLECAAAPASCADLTGTELTDCLWETLCEAMGEYESGMSIFLEGTLDCPTNGLDCFE